MGIHAFHRVKIMHQLIPATGPQVDAQTELELGDGCHVRPHLTVKNLQQCDVAGAGDGSRVPEGPVAHCCAQPKGELPSDLANRVVASGVGPAGDDVARFCAFEPGHVMSVSVSEGGHTWPA